MPKLLQLDTNPQLRTWPPLPQGIRLPLKLKTRKPLQLREMQVLRPHQSCCRRRG